MVLLRPNLRRNNQVFRFWTGFLLLDVGYHSLCCLRLTKMGSCVSTASKEGDGSCAPEFSRRKKRLAKKALKSFSTDAKNDQRFPRRMCSNGSSKVACVFTQQGRKGINQDAMVVWEEKGNGINGTDTYNNKRKGKTTSKDFGGDISSKEPRLFSAWKDTYLKAYKVMDKELRSQPTIDCFCSGSTAVAVVKQGQYLFIGNVGDSRAILGTKAADDTLIAIQLTVDLKPDLPREAERIQRCKGRVFALQDEPEVHRVWLPHDDAPGLAMARAFGDFCLKEYGVIAIPEVSYRLLTERDQFVVLASDGVWDVLSNEEVVEIVSSAPTRSMAARTLVESAVREWRYKYPTSKMDDCAVVCLYVDNKMDQQPGPEDIMISSTSIDQIEPFDTVTDELKDAQSRVQREEEGPLLQRLFTLRTAVEQESCLQSIVILEPSKELEDNCEENVLNPSESLDPVDQNWSGLEGVTRVNSLVHLPRFPEGKDM